MVDAVMPVFYKENSMLPDLPILLKYQHDKVIQSYIRTYQADEKKASDLFENMLKYLWISRKHSMDRKNNPQQESLQFQFVMHEEMREIDNMWHNFILYTQDYTQFCINYFGEYLHHVPDIADELSQTNEEFTQDLEKYLSYVYDHLGEETVRQWFAVHVAA